jgi:excinuclease ABC subunit C
MLFSDQMELFSQDRTANCIRGAVGTCLAPCATSCSLEEYGDRIEAARDFLAGRNLAVLGRLYEGMKSASGSRQFELAARLRDTHEDLTRLSKFLQRLREARRHSGVYPAPGCGGEHNWYLIREGQVVDVKRAPRDRRTSDRCLMSLNAVFPRDRRTRPPMLPEDIDVVLLVARWFREHPGELNAILSPEEARRRCGRRVDG